MMLYQEETQAAPFVTQATADVLSLKALAADSAREESNTTKDPKLCLTNQAVSQHFHQKKADANLCEFEVESTIAQFDFEEAEESSDEWQLSRSESQDCVVLYEDGLLSEEATLGSTIGDDDAQSVSLSCFDDSLFANVGKEIKSDFQLEIVPITQLELPMGTEASYEEFSWWDRLKKPLVELLLKFYNSEDQGAEFCESISAVLKVLYHWRSHGHIDPQMLLNFIIDQILAVLCEVKNKLIFKAIEKYDLLNRTMRPDSDGAPDGPGVCDKYIKDYAECPMAFDQMIISLTQYFDLINLNSYKMEDLWLNILEVLGLERPNRFTVFKAVHHQGFRNVILKDPLMQQIIHEVEAYKDSGLACMNPRKYLEEIYNIRRNCSTSEDSYVYLAEQGLRSEALRQLIDFLFDEIEEDLTSSTTHNLVHSDAQPALKTFEDLTLADIDIVSYNSDEEEEEESCCCYDEEIAPIGAF